MKESTDAVFATIISIWVLMFMLLCGYLGTSLLQANNYTHQANEIISRTGGLTKEAHNQLDTLKARYRHIDKVTLYQENKNNQLEVNAPQYRDSRIPYGKTEKYVIWLDPHFLGYKYPLVQSVNSDVRQ